MVCGKSAFNGKCLTQINNTTRQYTMKDVQIKDAVKQAVDALGADILKSSSFVNVLADYGAFRIAEGNEKLILKSLIADGYGEKIIGWLNKHQSNWKQQNEDYVLDFVSRGKFDNKEVTEVVNGLLQGVGLISDAEAAEAVITDPDQELDDAKKSYKKSLEKLVTKVKDCLGLEDAYFGVDACNELYYLEGKIALLSKFLNEKDVDWCKNKKQECLDKYRAPYSKRKSVAQSTIDSLTGDYSKLLADGIVVPKGLLNMAKPFYEDATIGKLDEMAVKLRKAQTILRLPVTFDSKKDRQDAIDAADKRRKTIRIALFSIIAIIIAIAAIIVSSKIRYAKNKPSIIAIENKIAEGDSLLALKQFDNAYSAYEQGIDSYGISYRQQLYQSKVDGKLKLVGEQSIDEFERQCNEIIAANNDYLPIEELIGTIPMPVRNDSRFTERIQSVEKKYLLKANESFEIRFDALLKDISKNKGKLSEWSTTELEALLKYNPNDYWLNFIKKRTTK